MPPFQATIGEWVVAMFILTGPLVVLLALTLLGLFFPSKEQLHNDLPDEPWGY